MKQTNGFTLIELMIAVVIVGILASIAFPSYQNYVRKTGRNEAKAELMDVATKLQRCYSLYGRYNDAGNNCKVFEVMEAGVITSTGRGFYEIDYTAIAASTYTLKATAVMLPQTADTGCTEMTLTHTGVRSPEGCW